MPSAERTIELRSRPARGCPVSRSGQRWTVDEVLRLFELPFPELIFRAQEVHRAHHCPSTVQLSRLISIKTGGCPEDCGYCPQAKRYHTGVADEAMLDVETVVAAARAARAEGRPGSAWAPHGAGRRIATWSRCSRWCAG
jgi:biotin synthase